MTRLPIRLRLTLGFAVVMAVVLSVVGVFAYHRLAVGLSDDLNRELRQRAQDLVSPVSQPGSSLTRLAGSGFVERGESFAQLMTPTGGVVQSTTTLHGEPLLSPREAAHARKRVVILDRPSAPGLNESARLLATPITRNGQAAILVVGGTRENGLEFLRRVRTQLLIGLPLLLLVTSGCGYLLSGAALRPVDDMRRRAAALSAGDSGQRLPLPPSNDEVARLGATLNDLLARVDATLEREREFVANASHELRTPLTLLKTELELAVRTPKATEKLTAAIHSAADEVDRLIQLTEDLLLLASFNEGRLQVAPRQVDVEALLTGVAVRFQHTAERLGRRISVRPNAVPSVMADPERVEQALANLVANAMQHGAGEVTLSARVAGNAAEIHVTDEGDGFSPEMLAHGFERFVHTPSTTGSGLGLSIVTAVSEAHAGSAGVTNRRTGGSDVWIRLPQPASRLDGHAAGTVAAYGELESRHSR